MRTSGTLEPPSGPARPSAEIPISTGTAQQERAATINHQRTAIERFLEQSPSLRTVLVADTLAKLYGKAVRETVIETDLDRPLLPIDCSFRFEDVLDEDWLPDV